MAESNSFVLFPKKDKKSERSPSATGSGKVTCPHCGHEVAIQLAAWRRTSQRNPNLQFLGGLIKVTGMDGGKEASHNGGSGRVNAGAPPDEQDIPF